MPTKAVIIYLGQSVIAHTLILVADAIQLLMEPTYGGAISIAMGILGVVYEIRKMFEQ